MKKIRYPRKLFLSDPPSPELNDTPFQGSFSEAAVYKESLVSVKGANGETYRLDSEKLFDYHATELAKFISTEVERFDSGAKRQNKLGFTCSLPLEQDPIPEYNMEMTSKSTESHEPRSFNAFIIFELFGKRPFCSNHRGETGALAILFCKNHLMWTSQLQTLTMRKFKRTNGISHVLPHIQRLRTWLQCTKIPQRSKKLKEVFKITDSTPMVREIVADVCDIVVERGARFAGAVILSILKKLRRVDTMQKSIETVEGGQYISALLPFQKLFALRHMGDAYERILGQCGNPEF